MIGMDCVNQQARERDCKLTKRSQAERLAIADSLIASVWEEYLNSSIDRDNLQVAAYIQANVNRIVWKLNALNNPNTPNTLEALDCISRKDAVDIINGYAEQLNGYIGTPNDSEVYAYARGLLLSIERNISALPSVQSEIEERMSETEQNVPNDDFISRKRAIDAIEAVFPVDPMKSEYAQGIACGAALSKTYIEQLPSAQPEPSQVARDIATIVENEQDMRVILKNGQDVRAVLKNAQPEQRWIPCTPDTMPDDYTDVLVWFEYYRYGDYNCLYQTYGIGSYSTEYDSWMINHETGWRKLRVLAYMPLPEPYGGEQE